MSNRTLIYMVTVVILGMALLLILNVSQTFAPSYEIAFISPNEVRGMATEHEDTLYTLNFEQQNKAVSLLNKSQPVTIDESKQGTSKFNFDKIIIYRFDKPDIIITPIAVDKKLFIYSCYQWNSSGLLGAPKEIKSLIDQTFDK